MNILMPQLGETVAEGKITKWFKSAGDAVQPGDNLFEIETDKVSMEVPATEAGVLSEIRVSEGEVVPVGAIVGCHRRRWCGCYHECPQARTCGSGSAEDPRVPCCSTAGAGTYSTVCAHAAATNQARSVFRGTHAARVTLDQHGCPAALLLRHWRAGSPQKPALISHDCAAPDRMAASSRATWKARRDGLHSAAIAEGPGPEQVKSLYEPGSYQEIPLDGMRRTIAARLTQAKQTIPHFYLTADITIDRLIAVREEANAAAPKDRNGNPAFKLSVNDFIIRALALALQRIPAANAAWAGDRILRFTHSDIGVAVAVDGGLIAPIIRNAETKSLTTISAEMKDLAVRARDKKLKPADYQGGSSAISNLGMYGVREFSAIINPPQSTILAVGAARRQAVEKADGGVAFASVLTTTLSCDHRVVDGALGAELLAAIKALIETPVTMLV